LDVTTNVGGVVPRPSRLGKGGLGRRKSIGNNDVVEATTRFILIKMVQLTSLCRLFGMRQLLKSIEY
jgi:hypothetical protein